MNVTVTIIENGEQLDCSLEEAEKLIEEKIIYRCPECGPDMAHLMPDRTLDEAVAILLNEREGE